MSSNNHIADLLRQAVSALETSGQVQSGVTSNFPTAGTSSSEVRRLFAPYKRWRPSMMTNTPKTTWTHKFCCLASPEQDSVPDKSLKKVLMNACLGEKRLQFLKNKDPEYFRNEVYSNYPKLKDGGGFELLRTNSRVILENITLPATGYTSHYLAEESGLGSAICYIRPMQQSLSLEPVKDIVPASNCIKERCISCSQEIPVVCLKDHLLTCGAESDRIPEPKRAKRDRPICDFACVSGGKDDSSTSKMNPNISSDYEVPCPVCGKELPKSVIEVHASTCGESASTSIESVSTCQERAANDKQPNDEKDSLEESMDDLAAKIKKETWLISVLRSCFHNTVLEELTEAVDEDWEKNIKIKFIGEEGIDAGGLSREFYSILFKDSAIFEKMSFRIDSELLEKQVYRLMGKATARALLMGHPGPKCFHPFLAKFICFGQEPDFNDITYEDVGRADVMNAIQELTSGNGDLHSLMEQHGTFLEQAGFRKCLTSNTVVEAACALKRHFTFYHATGALMQYREGLQLLGVLGVIQNYPESINFFTESKATAADIQEFFQPSYSIGSPELKAKEEIIVYNFAKFVKKAERGKISTTWIDIDDGTDTNVTITTGHVLQALIGCQVLPKISNGLILFDHVTSNLTTVNTCAPSISFSQTSLIQDYEAFENLFLRIIVESVGFGMD